MFTGLKRWWKNFLIRLEKSNEKQFGANGTLDCCDLNSQTAKK